MKVYKKDCYYIEEICKDCMCPSCENKKCDRVFCGELIDEKLPRSNEYICPNFVDWVTKITKNINQLEESRKEIIKNLINYILARKNVYEIKFDKNGELDKVKMRDNIKFNQNNTQTID